MSKTIDLLAYHRYDDLGKGASRRLRRGENRQVPAILYGDGIKPITLRLPYYALLKHSQNPAFFSSIVRLTVTSESNTEDSGGVVESSEHMAVLKAFQRHPSQHTHILHVDFMKISPEKALHKPVALHFVGLDTAPGMKMGGLFSHPITEIDISCLPGNLPEYIEVDVGGLELGQSVAISDLKLPEGVQLFHAEDKGHLTVAIIQSPRVASSASESEQAPSKSG